MNFKNFFRLLPLYAWIGIAFAASSCNSSAEKPTEPRVLVFSKTEGYYHKSIPEGNAAISKLGVEHGFVVDTTTDAAYFTDERLRDYAAVVFLSTSGDILDHYQEAAFERYIQAGGGFVGVHAATDSEYHWGWYGRLVGAYFEQHPAIQEAVIRVEDKDHPSTRHLPAEWNRRDEWYNFKNLNKDVQVLLTLDESSYEGGTHGEDHPIAWYHEYDGGRAFYTGLGHTAESYEDTLYLQHLLGGIRYAMGNNRRDYSRAQTQNVPGEDRFVKTVLTQGTLYEPTEMAILPNFDVLIAQRRGEIMLYNNETGNISQAGHLDVYHYSGISGVNAEEGVLGIAADPDFNRNRFVYIFYSPADTSVNRLSRFKLTGGQLQSASEKVILQFYSQRQICCHTGGSIAFGPDGLLYVSTGDNSTPFNEPGQAYVNHGFAPLDERPGHEQYDARRSSANTNDLRGKILRIRVKEDGSYEVPEGNLFPKGTAKTRPEIYTMGHRNPYRISVDQKNSFLYWGEVGPDAHSDSLETRGPRGYDEVNQARQAGNFGWPLFIAENQPYRRYDYGKGKAGAFFDPEKPVNDSRNNTGLRELPPAQEAFIWYPYADSPEFPQLGSGGRNSMAGPVYYADLYAEENRYPAYYHEKFFFYDWIRDWIKVATLKPNGDLDKIEPFMENSEFANIMDMEVGPDGRIYVLEYGKGWFMKNPEAGLSRIDYLPGNRPPKILTLEVDRMNGKLPFTLTARVTAEDPENDKLTYLWTMGATEKRTHEPVLKHSFVRPGDHTVSVRVMDSKGAISGSRELTVYAGNEEPELELSIEGNRSFFFAGVPVNYSVKVKNKEEVVADNFYISTDYIEGKDLAGAAMGHQVLSETMVGKNLMQGSDCSSCHKVEGKSIGPSFMDVAKHYRKTRNAYIYLGEKIIEGGSGVWGENAMPAHLTMDEGDANRIAKWIMSLAHEESRKASLPPSGKISPDATKAEQPYTLLRISALYTDEGGAGIRPLSGTDMAQLRSHMLDVEEFQAHQMPAVDTLGSHFLAFPASEGWIKAEQLDLRGITGIELEGLGNTGAGLYEIELRVGSPEGKSLGKTKLNTREPQGTLRARIPLQAPATDELQDVYIFIKSVEPGRRALLKTVRFLPAAS